MNKEINKCYDELRAIQDKMENIRIELWRTMSNLKEIRGGNNKVLKKRKCLYKGPHSKVALFFIKELEARLDKRPWTPSEEVTVMQVFALTLREHFAELIK